MTDCGITIGDIVRLKAEAQGMFRDKCKVGVATFADTHDPTALTWTYGTEISCGFDAMPSSETVDGAEATITDAVVRVPVGTAVNADDRIKVTTRNFSALTTAEVYAVVGAPRVGIAATVCKVKRITGESFL
jgi:hypothetical protein